MDQHISKLGSKYTAKHGFNKLVYFEEYEDINDARKREKQLKDWSQSKKRKLIDRVWKKL